MMKLRILLAVLHCFCYSSVNPTLTFPYNPASYLEVYPDPTEPEVLRERTPLYFSLIQSLGGPFSQYNASGTVAGVKVALDRINNDTSLLPGYTLHYTLTDSKCTNRSDSLISFFRQILSGPTKLGVVGSGCSIATEAAAEVSHFYNITQLSCASSSSELRNRPKYPAYFQLLSSEDILAVAYFGVIKEYNWTRVALIVQNENLFTVTMDRLKMLLTRDNITYVERLFDSTPGISALGDNPFDEDSRIFLFSMYAVNARPLLCEAYKRNIRYPRYLLLTLGWYSQLWWRLEGEGENLNCTVEERESVLSSSLAFLQFSFLNGTSEVDRNLVTTSGITGGEFLEEEKKYLGIAPLNATFTEYSQYCYDAVWTLAYALNATINSISDGSLNAQLAETYNVDPPFRLENFTYDSSRLLDIIFRHISEVTFKGLTGEVDFGDEGIRELIDLSIFQFRNVTNGTDGRRYLNWVTVATVLSDGVNNHTFLYNSNESIDTIWPNNLVPYDGVPRNRTVMIHPAVTVVYIILAVAGIAFACACVIFNFVYRNKKLIRLASSKLNYFIAIGAIILYIDVIFSVIPSIDRIVVSVFCNLTPWLTAIGYSLCYGTILVKMARVYYIFNNPSAKKKGIQDWVLVLGVGSMVAIDLLILIIYTAVEGSKGNLTAVRIRNAEHLESVETPLGIIINFWVYICKSIARDIFLGVLYGYKMALQVIALVLAFSIRKVKVKGLDDAKYIAAAIYVTSIVLAVIIVCTYTLVTRINTFASVFCFGFVVGTTVILLLVFGPLMVGLYKDPEGRNIFSKSSTVPEMSMDNNLRPSGSDMESLRKRVKDLETELSTLKKRNSTTNGIENPYKPPPVTKQASVVDALGDSHMVCEEDVARTRGFSGTIWDTPEKRMENGNGNGMRVETNDSTL